MNTLDLKYRVRLSDFREAYYYIAFIRKKNAFRVGAVVLLAFFVYVVLWKNGVVAMEPVAAFIACAYLIWFLLQFASLERQILKYAKDPNTLVNAEYEAKFGSRQFAFRIPARKFSATGNIEELTCAFEIAHSFLLYATNQQLFIVPTRDMTAEEASTLRSILRNALGDRFTSLFAKKK